MILKTLYVKLEDAHSTHEEAYAFLKASRIVCNFLEREVLKPLLYRCAGFNRIVIVAKDSPADGVFVNSSQVAVVECQLDRGAFAARPGGGSAEYYIGLIRDGLAKCAAQLEIPQQELLRGIDDFCGWRNEKRMVIQESCVPRAEVERESVVRADCE